MATEDASEHDRPAEVGGHQRGLTWWASIATIISAVLALYAIVKTNDVLSVTNNFNQSASEAQDLRAQVDSLKGQLASANSANASLRAQVQALRPPPTSVGTTDSVDAPAVRHQGTLTFILGSGEADLDAPSSDSQWGRTGQSTGSRADIVLIGSGSALEFVNLSQAASPVAGSDYTACRDAPTYVRGATFPLADLKQAQIVCVQTEDKRFASLTVSNVATSRITFDVTVYEKTS